MILLDMGLQIILVSASGVLTPGPLFFANLALSKYGGFWSGIKIAIGHTIVELPLIILYSLPFIVLTFPSTIFSMFKVISIIGGVSLIVFGIFYVVRTLSKNNNLTATDKPSRIENPILAGILFTGVNPFFFLWWISVGIKLISDSLQLLGYPLGIVFLFFVHIWMDYAWLGLSSYFTSRGIKIVGSQYHKFIITVNASPFLLRYQFHSSGNKIADLH
ncbi:MAG TPA: LysE family transporter [Nitrososphaeraceae archaeon]|nr:LysE family transporter [Nitrososphaeraceae archaeon]